MGKGDHVLNAKGKLSHLEWVPYEYENHLAEERRNAGYNINDFIEVIGGFKKDRYVYREIELGTISPVYTFGHNEGMIRPIVLNACNFLGISFAELFPREVCLLNNTRNQDDEPFTLSQLDDLLCTEDYSYDEVDTAYDFKKLLDIIATFDKSGRKARMFYLYAQEYTLREIGEMFNLSGNRCLQLVNSVFRELRRKQDNNEIDHPWIQYHMTNDPSYL